MIDRPALGRAVIARTAFRAGAWMARFDGVTVGYMTQHSLQKTARLHIFDTYFVGLLAHACEPNAVLDMDRQNLHALRAIRLGDLLTIDYDSTEDELFAPFACHCGAASCRSVIRGRRHAAPQGASLRQPDRENV